MTKKIAKKVPTKTRAAAIVTIHDAADMTPAGRRRVAEWLIKQAGFLLNNSKQMSKRFTARYLYEVKD